MDILRCCVFFIFKLEIILGTSRTLRLSEAKDNGLIHFKDETDIPCPTKHCSCENDTAVCINKKLSYIPKLPSNIKQLIFEGNDIPELNRPILGNVTSIRTLRLSSNNIRNVTSDAFEDFENIDLLDLSSNRIYDSRVFSAIQSAQKKNLTHLYLRNIGWTWIPMGIFKSYSKLTHLSLSGNLIDTFYLMTLVKIPQLKYLDLSFNKIRYMDTDYMDRPLKYYRNLKYLNLSNNKLTLFTTTISSFICFFPRLKELDLDGNYITSLQRTLHCLDKLETLILDHNAIESLENNTFSSLPSLKKLSLNQAGSRSSAHTLNVEKLALNNTSLLDLRIRNNNLTAEIYDKYSIFESCPNLVSLDISGNPLKDFDSEGMKVLFGPLSALEKGRFINVGITYIPGNFLEPMKSLKELYLSDNNISTWDGNLVFANITSIKVLYLDNNQIQILNKTSFPELLLKSLQYLNLAGNPFSCTCDSLWYLDMLKTTKLHLVAYPEQYICAYPPTLKQKNILIDDYQPKEGECEESGINLLPLVIPPSILSFVLLLILVSAYQARWHIRYWIFLLRSRGKRFTHDSTLNQHYKYDGFVIYCDEDKDWVHHSLLPQVENMNNLKLCVHYRDFDVGKLIVDNIVENMENSRKIIVVLSNSFAKSKWCLFELRLAQEKIVNEKEHELIPILLHDISSSKVSNCIHVLITMTTYIEWPKYASNFDAFWELVNKALKN